ncbi:Uncharacterized protein dnl_15470 [Desulfonema limicola]|uniref:Uncharacterized protein n=1 Tax=Desulfonema limicola TaxID=45656 RepID=A0A975GFL2_9BACT|nr:Uncharacterized protein dnl_15470 [Desulfonema limicola]
MLTISLFLIFYLNAEEVCPKKSRQHLIGILPAFYGLCFIV